MSEVFEIVPLEECETTLCLGRNSMEQWAYTSPGCKPDGIGWGAPIVSYTGDWLWRRQYEPGAAEDTQPVYVDLIEHRLSA